MNAGYQSHHKISRNKCVKRVRMRCSQGKNGCGLRFTLKKHPDKYKKQVRCPHCKGTNFQDADKVERQRRKEASDSCRCDGYPFPHNNKGGLRMCVTNKLFKAGVEPTEEEIDHYQYILETPRTDWM